MAKEQNKKSKRCNTVPLFAPPEFKVAEKSNKIKRQDYVLLDGSKRNLVKKIVDGSIITRFDKTPNPKKKTDVVCPHFLELKWATGCPYDCAWCYLKGTFRFLPYKTKPHLKDFNKIEEHTQIFLEQVKEPGILNAGELADALMYEGNSNSFVKFIAPLFESQRIHKLLLLTKSDRIENLLRLPSHKQIIASFSLNAIAVARRWEQGAPSVKRRLEAAKKLYDQGYEVRIRIDPMVPVRNWSKLYLDLIEIIFDLFRPERITLGSLRGLQSTINRATDTSWVKYLSEYSNWGKKIDINLRITMYRTVISHLKRKHNFEKIALCKETQAVWDVLRMDYSKIKCNCIW